MENSKTKRFYTFHQWANEMGDPSESALRWMHHTNKDGFSDACVIRRGNRLLVDAIAYESWLLNQNDKGGK